MKAAGLLAVALLVVATFLTALLAACSAEPTATPRPTPTPTVTPTPDPLDAGRETVTIVVALGEFTAIIADTAALRAQGLSGRAVLDPDQAMWFDLGVARPAQFWMSGMRFPLDIVWVDADLRVADVTYQVPVPATGTPDEDLPRYTPGNLPVRYVLEINAGQAIKFGISSGAQVTVRPIVEP